VIPLVPVAVVGGGRHAGALADHRAPFRRFRIAGWAPAGDAAEAERAASLADRLGVPFVRDAGEVVRDGAIRAVLVLTDDAGRDRIAAEALAAGKAVLSPGRTASAPNGGPVHLAPGELRYAPGVRAALQGIARGEAGSLHSMYVAVRAPRTHGGGARGVVDRWGWDVCEVLVHAAGGGGIARVQATAARLFGGAPGAVDTVVALVRFESGLIATVEISECLPASAPAAPADVEIEAVGTRRAIHIRPYQTAVRVYGPAALSLHPWVDPPVLGMVDDLLDAIDGTGARPDAAVVQRVAALSRRVDEAVRGGQA
jgi:predicted dehydrogenase